MTKSQFHSAANIERLRRQAREQNEKRRGKPQPIETRLRIAQRRAERRKKVGGAENLTA